MISSKYYSKIMNKLYFQFYNQVELDTEIINFILIATRNMSNCKCSKPVHLTKQKSKLEKDWQWVLYEDIENIINYLRK